MISNLSLMDSSLDDISQTRADICCYLMINPNDFSYPLAFSAAVPTAFSFSFLAFRDMSWQLLDEFLSGLVLILVN